LNPGPPEYEAGVLTIRPQYSAKNSEETWYDLWEEYHQFEPPVTIKHNKEIKRKVTH
jgi:hypothetical protein